MRNLLLEVRNVRRCEGGHSCHLTANGRKVAFIAPDIFEWSSDSARADVSDWWARTKGEKLEPPKSQQLKEGWESEVPDHKYSFNAEEEKIKRQILKWVRFHIQAFEIKERCKHSIISITSHASIYQWDVPPKRIDSLICLEIDGDIANQMSKQEIAKLLEERSVNGACDRIVEL